MRQPEPRPPVLGTCSNSNLTLKIIGNSVWVRQRAAGGPGVPFIWPTHRLTCWRMPLLWPLAMGSSCKSTRDIWGETMFGFMVRAGGAALYYLVNLLSLPNRGVPNSFVEPASYSAFRCQIWDSIKLTPPWWFPENLPYPTCTQAATSFSSYYK